MTEQEIEKLAFAGGELPDDMSYGDGLYFLAMRSLYALAKAGQLEPEQGKIEKAKIKRFCKKYMLDTEYAFEIAKRNAATQQARTAYRKAKTDAERLDAAKRLIESLDGVAAER